MRTYIIVGLGLLIGFGAAWAGDPGATENGDANLDSTRAVFRGKPGKPYHVVYVVDCSGSMLGSFDLVRSTVHNSIATLHENQQFRVISFGGQSFEPETQQLVRASNENKIKAAEFIRDVQPQGASDPIPALERAFKALSQASRKPGKIVYLITDGDFSDSEKVLATIRSLNEKKDVAVFAVQCGRRSSDAEKVLKAIAQENDGKYRLVGLGQAGDAKASSQPASAPSKVEAFLALVKQAVQKKPEDRGFRGGQRSTGLDFSPILASTEQYKALASFPEERGKQEEAISALAKERKAWALAALLNHGDVDVKIRSARALVELAAPRTVPALLAAAKANNFPGRGSESATLHSIYRKTLKEGLEKITGLKLTPVGLRITEYPKPGEPRVITSDDRPERFPEDVDFAKVEGWVTQKYMMEASTQPTAQTASAPATSPSLGADASIVKALLANLDSLTFGCQYFAAQGGNSTEYPSITLRVPVIRDKRVENWPAVQIDKNQAEGVVRYLATSGWLRRAEVAGNPWRKRGPRTDPTGPVYVLRLSAGGWEYQERLAFNAQTYLRLMELRDVLTGDAAGAIDKHMLAQLARKHPAWKQAGDIAQALWKELNLHIDNIGNEPKGQFLDLWAFTGKAPPSLANPGVVWLRPSGEEVRGIVDALAESGVLESLEPARGDALIKWPKGYLVTIIAGRERYYKHLGWDASMRGVLETIADRLPSDGHAAEVFHEILERLEPFRAEWDKAAGLKAAPIDWDKAGDYSFGPWRYSYRFSLDRQGKVVGHWGQMIYRGKSVEGINLNDSLKTPWGTMVWVGVPQMPNGPHGWMRPGEAERGKGRHLPSPIDAVRYHELVSRTGRMLTLIQCSQERVWLNLFGPDVEGEPRPRMNPLVLVGRLTTQQSKALLAQAAYSGLLSKAQPKWADWFLTRGREDYLLQFAWTPPGGNEAKRQTYSIDLGTRQQALEHLTGIKSVLEGKPAEAMETVLQRLTEQGTPATAPAGDQSDAGPRDGERGQ